MSPSVSVGDSGEFIAAAQTLSLPHAPSYPLFVILGKAVTQAVPWAHDAYRVNLLSMFFGALSCITLYLLGRSHGLSGFVSVIIASILFMSGIFREQSAATEVFTLHIFFAVALMLCFSARRWTLAFFFLGLGLGNHHTLVLIAPLAALLVWLEWRKKGGWPGAIALARELPAWIFFFLLGFSIYIFLPIRSAQNPPIDWSNPETLANFIRVVTRADYGSFSLSLGEKLPRNFDTMSGQIVRYLDATAGSVGWAAIAAGLLGWIVWFARSRGSAAAHLLFFAASGAGFLILGNMPFDSQSTGILPRFYLMSSIPLILAAGFFLDDLRNRLPGVHFFYAALPAALIFSGARWDQYRGDYFAHDYGRNLLNTIEPGAALFMDGGDDTFYTLAYFHLGQGLRPDLAIHDRGGLIFRNPYGDDFRRIAREQKEARRLTVETAAQSLRPLYYATFNREVLRGSILLHRGLLTQAVPFSGDFKSAEAKARFAKDYQERGRHLWKMYSMRGVYGPLEHPAYRLRALLPVYPYLEGAAAGDLGLFRRAAHFGSDIAWLQGNLTWESSMRAFDLTTEGRVDEAEKFYRFALEADPKFVSAYSNLGVLMERKNQMDQAEAFYRKSIEVDPKYAEAYYNLGVLCWKQSKWDEVIRYFGKTLELSPQHASARTYLELARRRKRREPAR